MNTQLEDIRSWQVLATYCRDQPGGQGVSPSPRLVRAGVCAYFSKVMFMEYSEKDVLDDFLEIAKRYCDAKFMVTNWRHYLTPFEARVGKLPRFKSLTSQERDQFLTAIRAMKARLSVVVGGRTENVGGIINVARTVVQEGEDTALFALFHEIGHGVQTEGDIPGNVKDAIFTHKTETGTRFGELFADAFASIALSACGRSPKQIMSGAEGALADHGSDADHPDWPTRKENIYNCLGA